MKSTHEKVLRDHALKCTPARLLVLAIFESSHTPLTVQALHTLMRKSTIDLVTLYRTLESFEKAGIIRRVDLRQDAISYELAKEHHHHIVCTKCGVIEDVPSCDVATLIKNIARSSSKFKHIQEHTFELFGVCTNCATS